MLLCMRGEPGHLSLGVWRPSAAAAAAGMSVPVYYSRNLLCGKDHKRQH